MAKRKKTSPTNLPAPWFRASVAQQREYERKAFAAKSDAGYARWIEKADAESIKRDRDKLYLQDSIKLLRQYAHGFEASAGFTLKDVARIRGPKLAKLRRFAGMIRQELAQPHVVKVVRSAGQRRALKTHTGQREIPGRFKYVVYTDKPESTTVRVVTPKKKRKTKKKGKKKATRKDVRGELPEMDEDEKEYTGRAPRKPRVEVELKVPGGKVHEQYFYVEDYNDGEPPESFKDIKRALKKMLKDMPAGYYVLVTENHGNIGVPAARSNLLRMLESDYMAYDKVPNAAGTKDDRGLSTVIVGFKLVSFTKEGADREYVERLTRRGILEGERRAMRRKTWISRRAKLTGRR